MEKLKTQPALKEKLPQLKEIQFIAQEIAESQLAFGRSFSLQELVKINQVFGNRPAFKDGSFLDNYEIYTNILRKSNIVYPKNNIDQTVFQSILKSSLVNQSPSKPQVALELAPALSSFFSSDQLHNILQTAWDNLTDSSPQISLKPNWLSPALAQVIDVDQIKTEPQFSKMIESGLNFNHDWSAQEVESLVDGGFLTPKESVEFSLEVLKIQAKRDQDSLKADEVVYKNNPQYIPQWARISQLDIFNLAQRDEAYWRESAQDITQTWLQTLKSIAPHRPALAARQFKLALEADAPLDLEQIAKDFTPHPEAIASCLPALQATCPQQVVNLIEAIWPTVVPGQDRAILDGLVGVGQHLSADRCFELDDAYAGLFDDSCSRPPTPETRHTSEKKSLGILLSPNIVQLQKPQFANFDQVIDKRLDNLINLNLFDDLLTEHGLLDLLPLMARRPDLKVALEKNLPKINPRNLQTQDLMSYISHEAEFSDLLFSNCLAGWTRPAKYPIAAVDEHLNGFISSFGSEATLRLADSNKTSLPVLLEFGQFDPERKKQFVNNSFTDFHLKVIQGAVSPKLWSDYLRVCADWLKPQDLFSAYQTLFSSRQEDIVSHWPVILEKLSPDQRRQLTANLPLDRIAYQIVDQGALACSANGFISPQVAAGLRDLSLELGLERLLSTQSQPLVDDLPNLAKVDPLGSDRDLGLSLNWSFAREVARALVHLEALESGAVAQLVRLNDSDPPTNFKEALDRIDVCRYGSTKRRYSLEQFESYADLQSVFYQEDFSRVIYDRLASFDEHQYKQLGLEAVETYVKNSGLHWRYRADILATLDSMLVTLKSGDSWPQTLNGNYQELVEEGCLPAQLSAEQYQVWRQNKSQEYEINFNQDDYFRQVHALKAFVDDELNKLYSPDTQAMGPTIDRLGQALALLTKLEKITAKINRQPAPDPDWLEQEDRYRHQLEALSQQAQEFSHLFVPQRQAELAVVHQSLRRQQAALKIKTKLIELREILSGQPPLSQIEANLKQIRRYYPESDEIKQALVYCQQVGRSLKVSETTDFSDLFWIGERPVASCLSFRSGSSRANLLGVFDPSLKLLMINDDRDRLVGRCFIRLVNTNDLPQVLIEIDYGGDPYSTTSHISYESIGKAVKSFAQQKAQDIGLKVASSGQTVFPLAPRFYSYYSDLFGGITKQDVERGWSEKVS